MDRTSYDSTWEEDEDDDRVEREWSTNNMKVMNYTQYAYMYSSAARDMQNYRHGYRHSDPIYHIDPKEMPNLHFYRNEMAFKPNGCQIEDFLNAGKDDYDMLEYNHNYIQWLFPLQERGVNPHAAPLHKKEIQEMKKDRRVTRNLLEAYKLMLGFYGLHLENEETGKVCRARNWKERYMNLNNHTHNNLRITRILKCMGELGFEHFQAPLVQFFLWETLCEGQLKNIKRSVLDYFLFSVKDKRKRRDLVRFAWKRYQPQSMFAWGPVDLLRNDQEALKGRKRGNCDGIREEDETRPQKIKKIHQDDKEHRNVMNEEEYRNVMNQEEYSNAINQKERRNVKTSRWIRTWQTLRRSLRIKKSRNVLKERREVEPLQNKPINTEENVTSQGKNRKRSGRFSCVLL
ncbi:opioid growth factor receptor-like isoform X2 [Rana temporaria]|uniref:opioid growth factor receptor-like isoform X2 n=1 Tax=Rana temporaria TaxID=8407 RepID=UPI001AADA9A9|nr:opioid growth factor receptor-like isoform X2 [Rana temporaria]